MPKKMSAPVVATQPDAQTIAVTQTIPPPAGKVKGRPRGLLTNASKTATMAVKCYLEQLPNGLDYTKTAIAKLDKTQYQAIGIVHNRDIKTDGIWAPSTERPHMHVIVRVVDRKKRFHVRKMLADLGIVFRPGLDDDLWQNRGVETVGNFSGYSLYLTHETEDAIRDAKELYSANELFSNLEPEEIERVRQGYIRMTDNRKPDNAEMAALDREAYNLGHDLGDFAAWFDAQPFSVRSHSKMKTVRESYERGVNARIAENVEITRLSVFVSGPHGVGKTTAAANALRGKRVLRVSAGAKTGKFDKLRPDHEAIIMDDTTCPSLLDMADNYICRAYKRGSNNPVWAGKYFIVTSNLTFSEWAASCGIDPHDDQGTATEQFRALQSRFYVCTVRRGLDGTYRLYLDSESKRGDQKSRDARNALFGTFVDRFNASLLCYADMQRAVEAQYDKLAKYRNDPAMEVVMALGAQAVTDPAGHTSTPSEDDSGAASLYGLPIRPPDTVEEIEQAWELAHDTLRKAHDENCALRTQLVAQAAELAKLRKELDELRGRRTGIPYTPSEDPARQY